MAVFPTLTPSARTFTPGEYPHSAFAGMSGVQVRVRNSNVMLSSQLRLTFVAITESQMLSILSHYQAQRGSFESFSLPSAVWSGANSPSDYQQSGYGWRYIDPPSVTDRMCADAYDVELTLETVPPEGTALSGLSSIIIASLAGGAPITTSGLNVTVTASIMVGGATPSGLAETVTASLAAGSAGGAVGAAGLSQIVWVGLTTQATSLNRIVTVSLAAGAGSGNVITNWTPANITTALWLDAAASSTITTVSGAVSQWNDRSGNSRHGTQSDSNQRPTVNATGINGNPALSFDGDNDWLAFPTGFLNGTTSFTVAMVISGPTQQNDAIWGPSPSFGSGLELVYTSTAFRPTLLRINNNDRIQSNLWSTNNTATLTTITASSTATAGWLNGSAVSAVSSAGNSALNFNGIYGLGRYSGGGFNAQMLMGEFIIMESSASTDDRQKLEGYLAHKWGLASSLPASHPYKSAAP